MVEVGSRVDRFIEIVPALASVNSKLPSVIILLSPRSSTDFVKGIHTVPNPFR